MNALLKIEISEILARHFLVEPHGWSREIAIIEYQCRCGELFVVDTRIPNFQSRDVLFNFHLARELEALGIRRVPDPLDESAIEIFAAEVSRRRDAAARCLAVSRASTSEMNRLEGALIELNEFAALIDKLAHVRAHRGNAPLLAIEFASDRALQG